MTSADGTPPHRPVLTMVVNHPINNDQADWNVQAPPAGWADDRDRWQIAHAVRTVAAVSAFGFLSSAGDRIPG
ncbi:DUF1772 domain-containing protein [Actinomadura rudentiformis]|uniref:DUF1772 domain-containing protein n=1 Tax=Actinomadura rudentiformis TaxID=359158 RepID=UPI001CEF9672|nr:DUF1772 domain-containing protein [Actinomadura rudentiformis]